MLTILQVPHIKARAGSAGLFLVSTAPGWQRQALQYGDAEGLESWGAPHGAGEPVGWSQGEGCG